MNAWKNLVAATIFALVVVTGFGGEANAQSVEFYQLDFTLDDSVTNNSDWGAVDLEFVGSDSILYFNLTVNGSWQVKNMPVLSLEGTGVAQVNRFSFDLGNDVGVDVTSIEYAFSLTPDTVDAAPAGRQTAPVGDDQVELSNGTDDAPLQAAPAPAAPQEGGEAADPVQHKHEGFPNQNCGVNECAPAAVSNSLQFLNSKHNLGMDAADITIAKMKEATKWRVPPRQIGCYVEDNPNGDAWWKDKDAYMKANGYPITTKQIRLGNTAADRTKAMDQLIKEIDAGQDIESSGGPHTECVIGITKNKDGTYDVTLVSDLKQRDPNDLGGAKEDGKGTGKHTDTYDPNTGTWGGLSANYRPTYFVVECPEVGTYYSTTDPGTIPPPGGSWVPVTPGTGESVPDVAPGEHLWISKPNLYWPTNQKSWTVTITGPNADKYGVHSIHGYRRGTPPTEVPVAATTGIKDITGPPKKRIFTFLLRPQPDWEVVDLIKVGKGEMSETIVAKSNSACSRVCTTGPTLTLTHSWFGVAGIDPYDIVEVHIFPNIQPVDVETAPDFTAPGAWTPSFVYTDPDGVPRPQGGVRWILEEGVDGLDAGEEFDLTMHMLATADSTYSLYALDSLSGEYLYFEIVVDATDYCCCCVNVADANASGALDIDDVVYLIQHIFSGGPAPVPCEVSSGDADSSYGVDIDDVVYLINHIFLGGPAPELCEDWIGGCAY